MEQIEYVFDTQMLVEGADIPIDEIRERLEQEPPGDSLLMAGDEELVRIHFQITLLRYTKKAALRRPFLMG